MISVADVLRSISDKKSLELFRIVVLTNSEPDAAADVLITKTNLTRRQYYSRMYKLIKTGLIKRRNGRHTLTAYGRVIYDTQIKIENAVNNYWNLQAIDSLEDSNDLPLEERKNLIDVLIDNQEIKAILAPDSDNKDNNNIHASDEHFPNIEKQRKLKPNESRKLEG